MLLQTVIKITRSFRLVIIHDLVFSQCVFQKVGPQNITKRLHLKSKAVHNLHWVLINVYPELLTTVPNMNSNAYGGVGTSVFLSCIGR